MTGIAAAFRRLSPLMARTLGDSPEHPGVGQTIELRRPCSLGVGEAAVPVAELTLVHATLAGAAALDLALVTAEGYPLAGTFLPGASLTLAGVTYRCIALATPTGSTITVQISPPLAADATQGAVVVLTPYVPYTLLGCMVAHKTIRDMQLPQVYTLTTIIIPQESIAAAGVPGGVQLEDTLILEDGSGGRVSAKPASSPGFVKVMFGP